MSNVSNPTDLAKEGAAALGLYNWGEEPTAETTVPDLLLHALAPHASAHPDLDIVRGVAVEIEAFCMFMEGPLSITLECMARRLRAAIDLAHRMEPPAPSAPSNGDTA